jgi:hypothetical protein
MFKQAENLHIVSGKRAISVFDLYCKLNDLKGTKKRNVDEMDVKKFYDEEILPAVEEKILSVVEKIEPKKSEFCFKVVKLDSKGKELHYQEDEEWLEPKKKRKLTEDDDDKVQEVEYDEESVDVSNGHEEDKTSPISDGGEF